MKPQGLGNIHGHLHPEYLGFVHPVVGTVTGESPAGLYSNEFRSLGWSLRTVAAGAQVDRRAVAAEGERAFTKCKLSPLVHLDHFRSRAFPQ